jgi:hypothetical protein
MKRAMAVAATLLGNAGRPGGSARALVIVDENDVLRDQGEPTRTGLDLLFAMNSRR